MQPALIASYMGLGLAAGVSGLSLLKRLPGWTRLGLIASLLGVAAEGVMEAYTWTTRDPSIFLFRISLSILILSFTPAPLLLFTLCYARANPGDQVRQWRVPLITLCFLPAIPLSWFKDIASVRTWVQEGIVNQVVLLNWPGSLVCFAMVVALVMGLTHLERTFRASVGTMRWRIKYAIIGFAGLLAARLYTSSQVVLYSFVHSWTQSINLAGLLFASACMVIALKRTEKGGVELYPSRGTIYGSISVAAAGIYLFIVGILFKLSAAFGGDSLLPIKSFLILAALGLVAAFGFSDRLRLLTKQFVSRHFNRPIYDYRKLWLLFTTRTASCRDVPSLCAESVRLISETTEALSVTIWLLAARDAGLSMGASTSMTDQQAQEALQNDLSPAGLAAGLLSQKNPFLLSETTPPPLKDLLKLHPAYFKSGGGIVCVPLLARDEAVGFILLGDRVAGVPFTLEDLDLLKCLGDQAAGSLLGLRLSDEIIRARELQAFQLMATFFVHDLKNTASSLSLMLQNFPAQFANPAFRDDAIKVVGKAVTRIRELITRLTSLRGDMEINRRPTDFNSVVTAALEATGPAASGNRVQTLLGNLPLVPIDPEHIQKVVVNLVLNAHDATPMDGTIEVKTEATDTDAVLIVSDTGCGMSPDFIRNSLFRPFQTTKRQGMGIGMFHCKTLVEAHKGRIDVSSEPGKGTIFQVRLPLK
ncbi:MAG: PEP-CTERM system histidine kinase PrsK [Verrucomicrobia bacterium]|nr:PEP-CTERM system histidine kinase PrsK [Verrucomicrobiota bacterium]